MNTASLEGGFANAPIDAAHAFRAAMTAMARPGLVQTITGAQPPAPLSIAAGTLLLTLADADTPVHLAGPCDTPDIRGWLAFHTGAPLAAPHDATFAIGPWDALLPLSQYPIGTPEYPDRSTTLIVERPSLSDGTMATLTGPGIKHSDTLALPDPAAFAANHTLFPLGLDTYFTAGDTLVALPRSTRIA